MALFHHSVSLDKSKCIGCTNCIKRCPTEAIRIRDGHAYIIPERCIDCGVCIRICPHKAKKAVFDKFESLPKDKYKIALPAPALYGQFENLDDVNYVLQGLLDIGFDDVYEVAAAAELVSDYTRRYLRRTDIPKPVISTACPVVSRLIMLRYPFLGEHILPIKQPMEVAAIEARKRAMQRHPELKAEDIVVAFISPCPAKVSYIRSEGADSSTNIDYVFSIREIYLELLAVMKKDKQPAELSGSGRIGIGWASIGGEATAIMNDKYLAADGIENVIRVLDEIDNGLLENLDFIELDACNGGCVGGVLTVINPYIAKARLHTLRHYLPISQNWANNDDAEVPAEYLDEAEYEYHPVSVLDQDRETAIEMMNRIEKLKKMLPGNDCGFCGSPTCAAFAADVVKGQAKVEDCFTYLRGEPLKKEPADDSQ
ncbi:MAG: [Fe-Fe] hydrogenase large subunit C-terminal domain-containing protein [Eubacteriales bacterium]